jgi:hypothetical protein
MAPGQPLGSCPRAALTISYFADGARVHNWAGDTSLNASMRHSEDLESYPDWLSCLKDGSRAVHVDLPLLTRSSPPNGRA